MTADRPLHPSAIHRVLGAAFEALPAAVRAAHDHAGCLVATGRAEAEIGRGPIPRMICAALGLPRGGADQPVSVRFETDAAGTDRWWRDFAGRRYRSRSWAGTGRFAGFLVERQGLMTTIFALAVDGDRLHFRIARFGLLGMMLPRWLAPRCDACETGRDGLFAFDITIDVPLIGRLIRYRGTLRVGDSA
jgi:hypothetical protein